MAVREFLTDKQCHDGKMLSSATNLTLNRNKPQFWSYLILLRPLQIRYGYGFYTSHRDKYVSVAVNFPFFPVSLQ